MARKTTAQPDNPAQHKRFIDMAREVEVDEREGALDRAFERIAKPKPAPAKTPDKPS
jgi:hypothetical protein